MLEALVLFLKVLSSALDSHSCVKLGRSLRVAFVSSRVGVAYLCAGFGCNRANFVDSS